MAKQALNSQPKQKPSERTAKEVESYLEGLFKQKESEAGQIDDSYKELLDQARLLLARGGKRLRPRLVVTAYEAFGGTDREAIIQVAASQELFHAFALMHDDIIDRDLIRWGGPNISGHYLKQFSKKLGAQDGRHYADAWALLAGDMCLGLSFEALSASGFTNARLLKAIALVQQSLFTMVGGELMDVAASFGKSSPKQSEEDYFNRLYASKTATYSFCTPLRLGALLAGAGVGHDRQLQAFGYHLGIAFQIKDDILGVFGDESKMGKSTLSDLREGKHTMLMSYGLQLANGRQKQVLDRVLGNPKATYSDLRTVQDILKTSGALEKTENIMQKHCDDAWGIMLRAGFPITLDAYLADLLSFSVKRSR